MQEDSNQDPTSSRSIKVQNSNKKLKIVIGILVLIIVALTSGLVYSLVFSNENINHQSAKQSQQGSQAMADTEADEEKTTKDLTEYSNDDYGVTFSYPAAWGRVATEENQGEAGRALSGSFSNNIDVSFRVLSSNFIDYGHDGGCGFVPTFKTGEAPEYEDSDSLSYSDDDKPLSNRTIKSSVFSDNSTLVVSKFEAGDQYGLGSCLGFNSSAYHAIDSDKTQGVEFSFATRDNQVSSTPIEYADMFMDNPSYFYVNSDFDGYVAMVKSVK